MSETCTDCGYIWTFEGEDQEPTCFRCAYNSLRNNADRFRRERDAAQAENAELRGMLEAAKEALEHYANPSNWNPCESDECFSRHYDALECTTHGNERAELALLDTTKHDEPADTRRGCSDLYCKVADPPNKQGTNGGCRCQATHAKEDVR